MVETPGSLGIECTSSVDYLALIVTFRQARSNENTSNVNIEGNVTALEFLDDDPKVSLEQLYSHRRFLLTNAGNLHQTPLQFDRSLELARFRGEVVCGDHATSAALRLVAATSNSMGLMSPIELCRRMGL